MTKTKQWIKGNLKPVKYGVTVAASTVTTMIDPSYAFTIASLSYLGLTALQTEISQDRQDERVRSGEIQEHEKMAFLDLLGRHVVEPITDALRVVKRLSGPSQG